MLRGLYGSAAGMFTQQRRQEMLTENLANANTPGFKADRASIRTFPNMLIQAQNTSNLPPNRSHYVGELSPGAYLQERIPNFAQGDLNETGNNTDIALLQGNIPINEETGRAGALFFTVEHEDGNARYTRNGNLAVDGQGFLTTSAGHYILDTAGERIEVGNEQFTVNRNGVVSTAAGAEIAQIEVAFSEDPALLVKEGDGLLRLEADELDALPTAIGNDEISYQLQQGFIERSNVDAGQTMTEMMQAFRAFEANQKVLQAYDQSLDKAVNEVGRIG
ncbi:flagellar hook-basal body protein [Desertibacillus haloalkaliphilus]|uniref:flagellar hook-basal body protein n=1 Tax=Desertibacillus haloalkaliphilus TaxID=1328930 RepID=UPI001C25A460|nr:flagellar hook-basal body protein [Desertibacillus haloalkaliphilus]MBU8905919.1 flagellar hook-basal body protein [Desertibacillus haloalkaliphilus]